MVSTGFRVRFYQEFNPDIKKFFRAVEKTTMEILTTRHFEHFTDKNHDFVEQFPHVPEFIKNYKEIVGKMYSHDHFNDILALDVKRKEDLAQKLHTRYGVTYSANGLGPDGYLKDSVKKLAGGLAKIVKDMKSVVYEGKIKDAIEVYASGIYTIGIAPVVMDSREREHSVEFRRNLTKELEELGFGHGNLATNCKTITKDCLYKLGMFMAEAGYITYKDKAEDESLKKFPQQETMSGNGDRKNPGPRSGSQEFYIFNRKNFITFTPQDVEHFKNKVSDRAVLSLH